MILTSPGSVFLNFGVVRIYYYGIIMALSVIVGLVTTKIICEKFYSKTDFETVYNLSLGAIISGFLGARIYYVLISHNYFINHLNEIFAIQNGGMSIHGAILSGAIFSIIYLKIKKLNVLKYLDILSFGLIAGQITGRWGNFFNSEAFGTPTDFFIKQYIPVVKRPLEFINCDYFHPTFLYESVLNCFLFVILILILKYSKKRGVVAFSYILGYSVIRFFIETIRIDSALNIFNIPIAQIVSIVGVLTGVIGIICCQNSKKFIE